VAVNGRRVDVGLMNWCFGTPPKCKGSEPSDRGTEIPPHARQDDPIGCPQFEYTSHVTPCLASLAQPLFL